MIGDQIITRYELLRSVHDMMTPHGGKSVLTANAGVTPMDIVDEIFREKAVRQGQGTADLQRAWDEDVISRDDEEE